MYTETGMVTPALAGRETSGKPWRRQLKQLLCAENDTLVLSRTCGKSQRSCGVPLDASCHLISC